MKELNKFRQFINEGKGNVDELFGLRGKPGEAKKAAKALDALEKALFELNFLDILGQEDYEDWLIKYEKLRGRVMAGLEDSDRKKYDYEGLEEDEKQNQTVKNADPRDDQKYKNQLHQKLDLDENDSVLDEVININEYSNDRDFEFNSDEDILGTQMIISDIENLIRNLKRWNNDGKTKDEYYGKYLDKEFNDMTKNSNSIYRRLFKHGVEGKTDKILSKVAIEWERGENDFMKLGNMLPGLNEIIKELEKKVKSKQERNSAKKNKKSELTIYDTWKEQNDAALDEVINEAKPNLKKALPTIAARNVERNNLINADIEDMMDMVGGAGKGEGSGEAEILFKASNASSDLEQALTDLQMYFEDDLGEGKEEE